MAFPHGRADRAQPRRARAREPGRTPVEREADCRHPDIDGRAANPRSGQGLVNDYRRSGPHTPYSVHTGTAAAIQDKRQAVLNAACAANPRRFTRRPRAPKMPGPAWISKPVTDSDITQHSPLEAT